FLPLLSAEDGYGLIYGGQIGVPNPIGRDSRLSFPLTWGGDKRAAAELEKDFDNGRTRLLATAAVNRRTHPYFDRDEDRDRLSVRAEHEIVHSLRVGATVGWQHVSFLDATDSFVHAGADVGVDTRRPGESSRVQGGNRDRRHARRGVGRAARAADVAA